MKRSLLFIRKNIEYTFCVNRPIQYDERDPFVRNVLNDRPIVIALADNDNAIKAFLRDGMKARVIINAFHDQLVTISNDRIDTSNGFVEEACGSSIA
ncbi:hypothetical protein D3C85_942640 [compost metagenome]